MIKLLQFQELMCLKTLFTCVFQLSTPIAAHRTEGKNRNSSQKVKSVRLFDFDSLERPTLVQTTFQLFDLSIVYF